MANYFGKGCEYFSGQWEWDERIYVIDYEENCEPELVHCDHEKNASDCEGNCCEKLCPLRKKQTKTGVMLWAVK